MFHDGGLWRAKLQAGAQRRERFGKLADDQLQRTLFDFQIVLGCNLLCAGQVVARLGFMRVGDGGGADLEITLGLFQLFGNGGFLRADQGQTVLRGQHIEIGLCHARDQVLRRLREHRFGLCHLELGLLVGGPVLRPVDRLGQCHRPAIGVEYTRAAAGTGCTVVHLTTVPVAVTRSSDGWQQAGIALRQLFPAGLQCSAGGGEAGIVFHGIAKGL